jgi:glycosyltransferase family protein
MRAKSTQNMNLVKIKIKRLFKRFWWKLSSVNEEKYMSFLFNYKQHSAYPQVKTIDETIDKLVSGNLSLARYGDGEFLLCLDRPISFQKNNEELRKRLIEILAATYNQQCLIAISEFRTERLTPFWKQFWFENIEDIASMLLPGATYYNQSVTREVKLHHIERIKTIWDNRYVIFVVGKGSRFDVNHELFSDVSGTSVLFGLPVNAWDNYDELLQEVITEAGKHTTPLVICALGPTATVMAFDLSQKGIQALDLGHLTNLYDRMKYNKELPEQLAFIAK